ncbi:uncharacterized protein LOC130378406 isoform X2 [Gadus chalcogrammus]|uniref:uncharacterized protein LOC130378406 isoform X2 n=1 Tax=Gadus chalcogrammus TaxID=1042646 RepID=UPI0024C33C02|nr:uncharacterized protein LOC130378406 isoform X2 [Gadus chalcogrammus]
MEGNCLISREDLILLPREEEDCGSRPLKGRIGVPKVLKAARVCAAPTSFLGHRPWIVIVQILFHPFFHTAATETSRERYERKRIRDEDKAPATCPTSQPEADTVDYSEDECKFVSRKEMHQLNLQYNQLRDDYEALKRELYATQEENKHLKEQLKQSKFGFDSIKDTNAKIIFFTGLQSLQMVMWLLDIVKRSTLVLKGGLSWENHLLLVLMKVRLGLTNRDLAYRFGLPFSTVSKILRDWIPMLSSIVKPLIMWPSKDAVRANMPKCFKPKFRNCRCIIDCTEIFIERTHNLKARAETWSNYKHQNTMKYLIGITPAGAISFLSSGWGGRASDKVITFFLNAVVQHPVFICTQTVLSVHTRLLNQITVYVGP